MKLLILLLVVSCSRFVDYKEQEEQTDLDKIKDLYAKESIEVLEHLEDGWLGRDCDGMIWNAKAGIVLDEIEVEAAEFMDEPGRFGRRPKPNCYIAGREKQESKTTWSKDMAICGLFPWALLRGRIDVLERHAEYGKANNWVMGKPDAILSRVLYTPAMIGTLYQMIYALGGENSANRIWPNIYPSGLEDYQAHLQVCSIWVRGVAQRRINERDRSTSLLSITETMLSRVKEHAEREPEDYFYQYVYGLYTGDMGPAIKAILDRTKGGYVRCGDPLECDTPHRVFVMGMIIRELEE